MKRITRAHWLLMPELSQRALRAFQRHGFVPPKPYGTTKAQMSFDNLVVAVFGGGFTKGQSKELHLCLKKIVETELFINFRQEECGLYIEGRISNKVLGLFIEAQTRLDTMFVEVD